MRAAVFALSVGVFVNISLAQNVLVNPSFEFAPILGPGQTDLGPGEAKLIIQDPNHPNYVFAVEGVSGWISGLNGDQTSDSGPTRQWFVHGERAVFINNWNRRLSQVSPLTVDPGVHYLVTLSIMSLGTDPNASKAARVSLVAGEPDPANPDEFAPGSTILEDRTAGTAAWTAFPLSHVLPPQTWTEISFDYTAPSQGPMIDKPLTVSLRTEWGSAGPFMFDNVSLEIVPEPVCYADCDGNGTLDFFDFLCFQNAFAAGCP